MADVVPPLDAGEILRRLQSAGFCTDLNRSSDENPHLLFNHTLSAFLTLLRRQPELRRLPPVISDGQTVDLFRLFSAVSNKGGYYSIASDSWGDIAEEAGFSPITGASLKSIYMRYLYALEVWLNVIPGTRSSGDADDAEALEKMVEWVKKVAKNPLDLDISSVSSGGSMINDNWLGEMFSRLLRVRKAMLLGDVPWMSNAGSLWKQDKRKMHPSLYEDQDGQLRSSRRIKILNEKSNLTNHADTILLEDKPTWVDKSRVGEAYQATLPDFSERLPEASMDPDELKWLGTRIWPCAGQKKSRTRQGQIGKGREECSCKNRGTIQCVRLHVSEKRLELMRELPPAFFNWSQGNIGEDDVARSWTTEEERRFKALVRLNPPYLERNLWDKLSQNFPSHGRRKLVSYYFNVFVLRLRSYQNRNSATNIDSDDEDNSFGFLAF